MARSNRDRRNGIALLAVAGFPLALLSLPAVARETRLSVPLAFVPTETEEVLEKRGVVPVGGESLEIQLALDNRPEPRDLIGQNREKPPLVPIWARTPVASWITRSLAETFRDWGAPNTPGADLVLQPEILKLFVVEEHTYVAEVSLKFSLKRRNGTEVWAGIVGGAATRFGRSLKESNYQEVISDAVFSCFSKLWVDPGFREAWAGKKQAQPVQAAAAPPKPAPSETLDPETAMKKALELKEAGFDDDGLVVWVKRVEFTRPLTSSDMLAWKAAGVPQAVIRAAME